MPKLPIVTAQDMISALQSEGFIVLRQKGSHVRLRHEDGRVVTVPVHAGCVLGRGLLRKILRDIEWNVEDLIQFLGN